GGQEARGLEVGRERGGEGRRELLRGRRHGWRLHGDPHFVRLGCSAAEADGIVTAREQREPEAVASEAQLLRILLPAEWRDDRDGRRGGSRSGPAIAGAAPDASGQERPARAPLAGRGGRNRGALRGAA